MDRACSSCDPWEKFSRATSMPDCSKPRIPASVLHDGPSVQMILARRNGEGSREEEDGILDDPLMIRKGVSIVREQAVKIVGKPAIQAPSTTNCRAYGLNARN